MSGWELVAVAPGVLLGLGVWTLVALLPRVGAPRLSTRIAPYVASVSPAARALVRQRPAEPASVLVELLDPVVRSIGRTFARFAGDDAVVAARLQRAGWGMSVGRFRSRQLAAAGIGLAVGGGVAVAVIRSTLPPTAAPVVVVVAAAIGLLAPDRLLARAARRGLERMGEEYPTVLEFLTLALAAGETVSDALRRVARVGSGGLAAEIRGVVAEMNAGVPLAEALTSRASALDLPPWTRTVDQLVAALERGAPLVDVLRAEAEDARTEAKRRFLESAGRKEVAMLVPLVFLILPVTILVAIFPGILVLRMGF